MYMCGMMWITLRWWGQISSWQHEFTHVIHILTQYVKNLGVTDSIVSPSLRSIRSTPSQLHSLQQIPMQHDMLPQHLVYKNELNCEYVIPLARNDETPWWWSEKIETCRSGLKCFKWKLYRCISWLIVEVILWNAQSNDEIQRQSHFSAVHFFFTL